MSRIANNPIALPPSAQLTISGNSVMIKGNKGTMQYNLHALVGVIQESNQLRVVAKNNAKETIALAGTTQSLLQNIITGVDVGFEKKLLITGVGYRAQSNGTTLDLALGFSHSIKFHIPEGITVETPSQTEIVIRGIDKQKVGQVSANIRAYRPPEPYKGKGIRYADEIIVLKEAKKA